MRVLAIAAVIAAAIAGIWYLGQGGSVAPAYRLAKVERGSIAATVSASGTLSAVVTVQVGSQVSGRIDALEADFNTRVKAGQVVARIDPEQFKANLAQSEAELAVTQANVSMQRAILGQSEADLEGARAALAEAGEDLKRKRALFARRDASAAAVDKAVAANDQAAARVKAAAAKQREQEARIEHALAQVEQAWAALQQRRIDLDRTIIRSPVDGVVISRDVDVGQTVAASLQAPVLFTIAQDLSSMQVEVSVDEADVGQVVEDQTVSFEVDAFPGRRFSGRVRQVRMAPIEVSNVVTYTVVVSAANPDARLLPGMTANVSIVVGARDDALKVPSRALRFRPEGAEAAPSGGAAAAPGKWQARRQRLMKGLTERLGLDEKQQAGVGAIYDQTAAKVRDMVRQGVPPEEIRPLVQEMRARNRPRVEALLDEAQRKKFRALVALRSGSPIQGGRVWVQGEDGAPRPVDVRHGISDDSFSEIVSGELEAGQEVIVGVEPAASGKTGGRPRLGF